MDSPIDTQIKDFAKLAILEFAKIQKIDEPDSKILKKIIETVSKKPSVEVVVISHEEAKTGYAEGKKYCYWLQKDKVCGSEKELEKLEGFTFCKTHKDLKSINDIIKKLVKLMEIKGETPKETKGKAKSKKEDSSDDEKETKAKAKPKSKAKSKKEDSSDDEKETKAKAKPKAKAKSKKEDSSDDEKETKTKAKPKAKAKAKKSDSSDEKKSTPKSKKSDSSSEDDKETKVKAKAKKSDSSDEKKSTPKSKKSDSSSEDDKETKVKAKAKKSDSSDEKKSTPKSKKSDSLSSSEEEQKKVETPKLKIDVLIPMKRDKLKKIVEDFLKKSDFTKFLKLHCNDLLNYEDEDSLFDKKESVKKMIETWKEDSDIHKKLGVDIFDYSKSFKEYDVHTDKIGMIFLTKLEDLIDGDEYDSFFEE